MIRKIISFICLLSIFIEAVPVNALSYGVSEIISQEKTQSNSNNDTVDENSGSGKIVNLNDNNGKSDSEDNSKEVISNLEDNIFNGYIDGENELAFSIGFDKKESKFVVKNQSEKQLAKNKLDTIIYKISVYDKENKEKLNIELLGRDTGNTEKLNILNKTKYEIGDTIKITPLDSKNGLKIFGDIQGDIDKNKEDYSDGVDNLDYIDNVRFEITENNLKTVYNEAPVIHGLSDIKNSTDLNADILKDISVTDDKDGKIDNSNIITTVDKMDENSLKVTYTVTDSWGRVSSGSRVISSYKTNKATTFSASSLSDIQFNIGGVTYAGGAEDRFRIRFDVPSSSLKVVNQDGRLMSNVIDGDYFKFELYDKNMNLKESVTLLGRDKSTSDKLKKINNLKYVVGDYIYIWHAESSTKLKINGYIEKTDGSEDNYEDGIDEEHLINHRFEITNIGLKDVKNTAPVISELTPLTVSRGETPNLWKGVRITDDKDKFTEENVNSGKVSVSVTDVDTSILGNHTVTYTATDAWGLSSTITRTIIVSGTNPIENKFIEVYKKNNNNYELAFKIGFDSVKKTYLVSDTLEGEQLDSTTDNTVFKLRVFSEEGILKKTLNIKGNDILNSSLLSKIHGFKYDEGDYIELWSSNPKNGLKITGGVDNTVSENNDPNIQVNTDAGIPEDYSNGIDNDDYMKNVRFKIKTNSIEAVYNKAPVFKFEQMTVKRGEKVKDLLKGVTVTDDHDKYSEADLKKKVSYGKLNTNKLGDTTLEYRITDNWGRTTIATRTITVINKNILETQKINVKNNGNVIFSLSFDSILKKFIVNDINLDNLSDDISGNIFKMEVYGPKSSRTGSNLEKKSEVTITSDDLQNKKFTSKFEKLSFEEGYFISLWSYDYTNGIDIKFAENNTYTFENDDKMNNTRFKIMATGLEKKYNEKPQINGVNTKYIFKGNGGKDFDPLEDVSVSDDIDGTIPNSKVRVTNNDNFDKNTVGDYEFVYTVQDSWGRITSVSRNVRVISKSVSNDIEFYNKNDEKIFSLKYNPDRGRFDVNKTDITTTGVGNNIDKVFELNVFNTNSEKIGTFSITNEELANDNKLNEILNLDVQDDYYFSIWSYDPSKIKIQGDLLNNNSLGDDKNQTEDYHDGISCNDYMENVRFKVTQAGFECVYNNKPTINNIKPLEVYAGDEVDYLEGITISDDHDRSIDKSKIKITNGNNQPLDNVNDEGKLVIGNNTIKYTVADSWGRETTQTTTLTIKEGMGKNVIRLQGGQNERENVDRLNIGFNTDDRSLKITKVPGQFNPGMSATKDVYYRITITNSRGENYFEPIEVYGPNNTNDEKFNPLDDYRFEYGDRIKIFAWHPYRVKIDGKVIDAREDYLDGFDIPMNLLNVEFEITHSGLKSHYTESIRFESGETNIIAPIAPEGYPIKYAVLPNNNGGGKLVAHNAFAYSILYGEGDNNVLRIAMYDQNGNIVRHNSSGQIVTSGGTEAIKTFKGKERDKGFFSNKQYRNGYYLYIQHKEPKRVAIYGEVDGKKEDYSDGFEEELDMRNTIFRFNETGLQAVYNEAPIINGIEDTTVYLGTQFNPMKGVTVSEDEDEVSTNRAPVVSGDEVNTNRIGEYEVVYTVRDNWGRVTNKTRKVTVVPRLNDTRFKIYADKADSIVNPVQDTTNDNNINIEQPNVEETPLFEIGFDPVNEKYKVYNQKANKLSEYDLDNKLFNIIIRDSNNNIKENIALVGNDRGTSPKLNAINEVEYDYGDTIEVYRQNHTNGIKITGKITGDTNDEDYSQGIVDFDNMINTRFKVSQEGLVAIYNDEPKINIPSTKKTIIKGDTVNLLEDVTLANTNDEHDSDLSVENIDIYLNNEKIDKNYKFNQIGKYTLYNYIVDNWGRSSLREVDLSVESRVNLNDINVYHNGTIGLTIGFDTENSNLVVKNIDLNSTVPSKTSNNNSYFSMIVRDRKGNVRYSVSLNGNPEHDTEELSKIHNKSYSRYDSISLSGAEANTVRIDGDIVGNSTNYSEGFGSLDKYNQVRFTITDDGLKEVTQHTPTLSGLDKMTIKRGDDVNFMEGVSVNIQDSFDEDYTITVNKNGFNKLKEGTYTVIYNVTTSWGVNVNYKRTVEVEPRTELEKVKMVVKRDVSNSRTPQNILTIGFDSINNKLRVIDHIPNHPMQGNASDIALRLTAYNDLGTTVGGIELHGNESITDDFVNRINNFAYYEGYSLSVWYLDYSNLSIQGKIKNQKEDYSDGIKNKDYIENVRFTITEEGLESVYNKAPEIKGNEKEIIYYKGSILDPIEGLSVEDDHDSNIQAHDIVYYDSDVDLDTLGDYSISYTVEDSWGRKSKVYERKIVVKSGLDLNNIEIYAIGNSTYSLGRVDNRVFGISFDEGILRINNRNNIQIDSTKPNQKVLSIKVYDSSMEVIKNVELNGNDTGESNKLDELDNYNLNSDEFLSVEDVSDEFAKHGIKITGKVISEKENYEDGIDNIEHIEDVKFKLTEYGLESVFNTAPKITFDGELNALLGDDIDYMKGVTIKDDHDKLGKSNVKVTGLENGGVIGTNEVTYTVTDLWGKSTTATRIINLSNALPHNTIQFMGHRKTSEQENAEVALTMKFVETESGKVRMQVSAGKDMWFREGNKNNTEYAIAILDKNNSLITYNTSNKDYNLDKNNYTSAVRGQDKANAENLNFRILDGKEFEYGYKIKFFAWHQDLLRIQGPVRGAKEDYSDGVQQGDNYSSATFEITKSGLKATYKEDASIDSNKYVTILPSAREGYPMAIRIDFERNRIDAINGKSYSIEYGTNDKALELILYDAEGNFKRKLSMTGNQNPVNNGHAANELNGAFTPGRYENGNYVPGDYLTIYHRTPKNLSIRGNETLFTGGREDYSDGIDDIENMKNVILRLNEDSVNAVYIDPPTIEGTHDRIMFKGDTFDPESFKEGVTATDPIEGNLTNIEVTHNIASGANNTLNKIGLYDIRYTVANSKGVATSITSTVEVQAKPVITLNEGKNIVELDSVKNTPKDIDEYLKSVVTVTDEEDDAKGKMVKLEIEGTFDPTEEGSTSSIKYIATDSNGNKTEKMVEIQVNRTINVSVPVNLPFQVVTNLKNKETDPFISGILSVKNNNTSEIDVYIESFIRVDEPTTKGNVEQLELVGPDEYDWDNLSSEETMKYMALGMYVKSGLTSKSPYVKESPLWLKPGETRDIPLGIIPRAKSIGNPSECKLSFTSKHGKNFIGGTARGKFELVFMFE